MLLPVKEMSLKRGSWVIHSPVLASPLTVDAMAPGRLFLASTSATILVMATVTREVVGAPFLEPGKLENA